MKKYFIAVVTFLILPTPAWGSVIVSEIAWMGSSNSSNDEWIELYNPSKSEISLDGWKLEAQDGTPKIILAGIISAGGFYILERSVDTSLPLISADLLYSGSLSNSGENLILKNSEEEEIDRVDNSSGWIAGDNSTKYTMQRSGSLWITATSTPKATTTTWIQEEVLIPTEDREEENNSQIHTHQESITASTFVPSVVKEFQVGIGRKRVVPHGNDILLKADLVKLNGASKESVRYIWTLGDGSTKEGKDIHHTYSYPGEYVVVLNAYVGEKVSVARTEVSVFSPEISINSLDENAISLQNNLKVETNLTAWKLNNGSDKEFIFPIDTILSKNQKIFFTHNVTGFSNDTKKVELLNPLGEKVASFNKTEVVTLGEIKSEADSKQENTTLPEELVQSNIPSKIDSTKNSISDSEILEETEKKDSITTPPQKTTLKKTDIQSVDTDQQASVISLYREQKEKQKNGMWLPARIVDSFLKLIK